MSIEQNREYQRANRPAWLSMQILAVMMLLAVTVCGAAWADSLSQAFSAEVEMELFPPDLSCENTDDDIQDVIEQMADLGYGVATAKFKLYDLQLPDVPTIDGLRIPFAERTSVYSVVEFDDGSYAAGFNGQDALVFRGCSPPGLGNFRFSFNSFLDQGVAGFDDSGNPVTVPLRASLADPVWLEDLVFEPSGSSLYDAPYDRKFNLAFTADRETYEDLQFAFENADLAGLNVQPWPGELMDYTSAPGSGRPISEVTFFMKWDRTRFYHPDAYEMPPELYISPDWTQQSFPVYIFYRNPAEPREAFPLELLKTKPPSWQKNLTKQYRNQFDKLINEVVLQYEMEGLQLVSDTAFGSEGAFVEGWPLFNAEHGAFCIDAKTDCQFDSQADNYWWDQRAHVLGDDDIYVVVGIDHAKLGMAEGGSYLGMFYLEGEDGLTLEELDGAPGGQLAGNVDEAIELSDSTLESVADLSFLVEVARPENCVDAEGGEYEKWCPDAETLLPNESFVFRGRTSFNPETGTRPSNSQLIAWRLLHFKK